MIKHKTYREYFMEICPECSKQVSGSTEKQCRHNFAMHLSLKHNVPMNQAKTYKINMQTKKIVYASIITGLCIITPFTNLAIGIAWMWALSPLSFSKCVRYKLDVLSEKLNRWRYRR